MTCCHSHKKKTTAAETYLRRRILRKDVSASRSATASRSFSLSLSLLVFYDCGGSVFVCFIVKLFCCCVRRKREWMSVMAWRMLPIFSPLKVEKRSVTGVMWYALCSTPLESSKRVCPVCSMTDKTIFNFSQRVCPPSFTIFIYCHTQTNIKTQFIWHSSFLLIITKYI